MVAAAGILSITAPAGKSPSVKTSNSSLSVYEEMCSSIYGPPPVNYYMGTRCESPNGAVDMPTTYSIVTLSRSQNGTTTTIREAYFAVFLAPGQEASVSIGSSAPLNVYAYFDNRTGIDTQALANETAHGAHQFEGTYRSDTFHSCLPDGQASTQNEWYIFQIFGGQIGQTATVTFNIQSSTPCTTIPPQG
jgi:hypothetical protein